MPYLHEVVHVDGKCCTIEKLCRSMVILRYPNGRTVPWTYGDVARLRS